MEDEQNRGGEEIGQDVETLEREEEINGNDQTRDDMWMPCRRMCAKSECTCVREKYAREGVLFTHSVGYSGSQSTVNENNCNKNICVLTSNSIRIRATTKNLKLKANIAILYVDHFERYTSNLR